MNKLKFQNTEPEALIMVMAGQEALIMVIAGFRPHNLIAEISPAKFHTDIGNGQVA